MSDDSAALDIIEQPLGDVLSEKYLAYALSTIMARSLPDVRDGLKPVHRRLLFAMRQLRLASDQSPKKSARVVGDVIGQFHPHSDQAVYDTLVRLSQDFAQRYPLVDGQGNFGNIDGDNAAAMRYTEARLTAVAEALMEGLDEDAVDFRPTYDGEAREPAVLPGRVPNLLANGASGIAVGMASSVPPHNIAELARAAMALIDDPQADSRALMTHMPGPDFPTGGVLVEDAETLARAYETGRGSLRLRARWQRENRRQGTYQIVVTEIPYQVQKSKLVEKLAELITTRKVPMLEDVRDESAEDLRLVLVPRSRNVEPEILMEALFRHSELETRFALNMNVLDRGTVPRVMSLAEILAAFLAHRREVLLRRTRHRLARIARRLEVLDGYLVAYLNLDAVIRIIREGESPRAELMAAFDLTELQADSILDMRLRALHKLQEIEITRERTKLAAEQGELEALLGDEGAQWGRIRAELEGTAAEFGPGAGGAAGAAGGRRTEIARAPEPVEVPLEAMVEREPVTVLCSEKGWIRSLKGHIQETGEIRHKEGDRGRFVLHAQTTDKLLAFTTDGRFYTLRVDQLPAGRGFGQPLRLMVEMAGEVDLVALKVHRPGGRLLVASQGGRGFLVDEDSVVAQTRQGKQILTPEPGEEAALCVPVPAEADHLAVIGHNRRLLIFPLAELPERGRGKGVILQRYRKDALLGAAGPADAKAFRLEEGLSWPRGDRTRTETDLAPWLGKRGQAGKAPPHGFPRSNRFSG